MNFKPKSLRAMHPHAVGLVLALTHHAEFAMPETPGGDVGLLPIIQ